MKRRSGTESKPVSWTILAGLAVALAIAVLSAITLFGAGCSDGGAGALPVPTRRPEAPPVVAPPAPAPAAVAPPAPDQPAGNDATIAIIVAGMVNLAVAVMAWINARTAAHSSAANATKIDAVKATGEETRRAGDETKEATLKTETMVNSQSTRKDEKLENLADKFSELQKRFEELTVTLQRERNKTDEKAVS